VAFISNSVETVIALIATQSLGSVKVVQNSGSLLIELDLEIISNGHRYDLTWSKDGVVTSIGIGLENSNTLSAGYYDV